MLTYVFDPSVRWKLQSFDVGQREEGEKISLSFQALPVSIPTCNSRTCLNWKATRFAQLFVTRNILEYIVTGRKYTQCRGTCPKEFESSFPFGRYYRCQLFTTFHEIWTKEQSIPLKKMSNFHDVVPQYQRRLTKGQLFPHPLSYNPPPLSLKGP